MEVTSFHHATREVLDCPMEDQVIPDALSQGQFDTVYNFLSLVIASQLFTALFLLISLPRILPRYRNAITVAIIVCGIAAYHYFRIFDSFKAAFVTEAAGLVMSLSPKETFSKSLRLGGLAALMIALGYPGEISDDNGIRGLFGILSTLPFLYILFVLFTQLSKSLDLQPAGVRKSLSNLRWLLLLSWGVYPIAYALPILEVSGADAWVAKQIGYSVADIVAKAAYALIIYRVARIKSFADDAEFARAEQSREEMADQEVR